MPHLNPSYLPGTRRLMARVDEALRWRAAEEVGRHVDGLYGRIDQLNDRIEKLEARLSEQVEGPPSG
jgi:hypothetical protein